MENEKEFYIAYLRNPKQNITNGFQDIDEMEVIAIHEFNDFREVATRDKIYLMDKNEVFDGHKVYKSHAGFIGRIGRQLTLQEANEMLTNIRNNGMEEYMTKINTLIKDTLDMYMQGE